VPGAIFQVLEQLKIPFAALHLEKMTMRAASPAGAGCRPAVLHHLHVVASASPAENAGKIAVPSLYHLDRFVVNPPTHRFASTLCFIGIAHHR
jgi:hypothetical protein